MRRLLMSLLAPFLLIAATPIFPLSDQPAKAPGTTPAKNWYDAVFFKDPSMNFEFIRGLGYTYEQGADIGEAISTSQKVSPTTINAWYTAWLNTANRIYQLGQKFYDQGDSVSAASAFLRASNYYRMASFYMDAPANRPKAISSWAMSQKSFKSAIRSMPALREIQIPYEKTMLHGYFIPVRNRNAPLVILNTGFDGTAEELYFVSARAAHRRGFNVLFFDGPGEGQSIKVQNIPFRPDWEKVIGPIIHYARTSLFLKNNKIALIGFSMGGYLAARACAFLPEIKACILDPGVSDFSASALANFPPEITNLLNTNPKKFNEAVKEAMNANLTANWFFNNGMWVFATNTPDELIKKIMVYRLGDWVKQMKMPTLVIEDAGDIFVKKQAEAVYKMLPEPKTLYRFSVESTAEAHCQVGAQAISNEVMFNWLKQALASDTSQAS